MKVKYVLLLSLLFLLITTLSYAYHDDPQLNNATEQKRFNKTISAQGVTFFSIDNPHGSVTIRGVNGGDIEIRAIIKATAPSRRLAEEILDGKKMRDQVCLAVKQGTVDRFTKLAAFRKEDTLEFMESVLIRYLEEQKKKLEEQEKNIEIEDMPSEESKPDSKEQKSPRRRENDQFVSLIMDKLDRLTGICERMATVMDKKQD